MNFNDKDINFCNGFRLGHEFNCFFVFFLRF